MSRIFAVTVFLGLSFALPADAMAADKCDAVYKKFPVKAKCHKDNACIALNAENRQKRISAGCKASRNSED